MPNWCNNVIELTHEDPTMIERARLALIDGKFLNEFIPVPADLQIVAGSVGAKGSPEQEELELKEELNRITYGYSNWYDFCVGEWGTKWDVGGDGVEPTVEGNKLTASFDSAWSPPLTAYEKLTEMGFTVKGYYYEPGMCYAGIWEDGNDDYYEYGNMDSKQVAEEFPTELDEMFAISESMADWEQENLEDSE